MSFHIIVLFAAMVMGLASPVNPAYAQVDGEVIKLSSPLVQNIHTQLQNPAAYSQGYELQKLYEQLNYEPIWLSPNGDWKNSPEPYVKAIEKLAYEEGMHVDRYRMTIPSINLNGGGEAVIARAELNITSQIMNFIHGLRYGQVVPEDVFPLWFAPDAPNDVAYLMQEVLKSRNPESTLRDLAPPMADYAQLRTSLEKYRGVAKAGGWKRIPSGEFIKPGGVDTRIPLIRERLQQLGRLEKDYDSLFGKVMDNFSRPGQSMPEHSLADGANMSAARENPEWVYRYDMEPIIKEFQQRRGAKVDGVIGPETIAELNVSVEDRVKQIQLAMEQWRWLPRDMGGDKYVFVNSAGYYALAVENGDVKVRTPVIVGEVAHETPSFSSSIYNVKFYPDWTVPESITHRYLIKKIQNNPSVVQSLGYELSRNGENVPLTADVIANLSNYSYPPYRFRQRPGTNNALGLVRFSIVNDYSIYMHDTSNPDLFASNDRNFSSGCIRVEEKERMAEFLLAPQGYSLADVQAKFNVAGRTDLKTDIIPLEKEVPVHIMYMTAWIDENGHTRFEGDAYGRDVTLKRALGI